jgi:predicted phosphodiesterase
MVVTDLPGDWEIYQRYRDRFVDLQAKGQADYLILTGDLIHGEDSQQLDKSVEIVLDVIELQARYMSALIYVCGNHELPHIYGISLSKGRKIYTPDFERALNQSGARSEIISLFHTLPFFVRTEAGVTITHAGASAPLRASEKACQIFNWSHQAILDWADESLAPKNLEFLRQGYANRHQIPYDTLIEYYLDVSDPADPRYNDLLRGFTVSNHTSFEEVLWPVLFTRCEEEYALKKHSFLQAVMGKFYNNPAVSEGDDYNTVLEKTLAALSVDFIPQQVLVAGHIKVEGGHQIVAQKHLRLASGYHATPTSAGKYLLFDTAHPIKTAEDLLSGLGSVYSS